MGRVTLVENVASFPENRQDENGSCEITIRCSLRARSNEIGDGIRTHARVSRHVVSRTVVINRARARAAR